MFKKIFLMCVDFVCCHFLFRIKCIDKEKIDSMGKCLVCPNHSTGFDPFWVYTRTKNMWIMAKAELFKNKIMAKLFEMFNIFPIKRGQKDASSILHAINVVERNEDAKLLIFPEGTRVPKDKERGKAKVGPVYIAAKAQVPIVPVYITRNAKLFSKVTLVYGQAIDIPKDILENKEEIQRYSDMLLDKIYELKNKIK